MDPVTPASPKAKPMAAAAWGLVLVALLLPAVPGCARRREPSPPPAPAPLARVGDSVITADDVTAEAVRLRAAGQPATDAREVLHSLIERQAMLQEASASPLIDTPDARRERENLLLSQWLQQTLQAEIEKASVSEDDLRAYYDANTAEFTRPAMVRLAVLYRKPSPRGDDSSAASLATALRGARQAFLDDTAKATRNGRIPGFGAIAAEASEDAASRYRGGDIGWLEPARGEYTWPDEVMQAGFALPVGGASDVITAGSGLYVVMKQDEREARTAPFEEVSATLRRRLLRAKRELLDAAFKSNVVARVAGEIDAAQAAQLKLPENIDHQPQLPTLLPVAGAGRQPPAAAPLLDHDTGMGKTK